MNHRLVPMPPRHRWRRRRAGGLTLVELLLALAVLAVVASATVAVVAAVAAGTVGRTDQRQALVLHKTLDARLSAAIRGARQLLAAGDDFLVLWNADADSDEGPRLSELQRIEFAALGSQVRCYAAPAGLAPEADTLYTLETDFAAVTAGLRGGATFPGQTWAQGVTACVFTLDEADAREARLVSYRITLAGNGLPDTAVGAAAPRLRN